MPNEKEQYSSWVETPHTAPALPGVVTLEEKDAAALANLETACFSLPWSVEQYRKFLAAAKRDGAIFPPCMVFGIRKNMCALAGYISVGLHHCARELEIYNIAVAESSRRQGYGALMLDHALDIAGQCGLTRAVLEVRENNTAALALYAKAGFSMCGRRKKYYSDTGEDALVLCSEFSATR